MARFKYAHVSAITIEVVMTLQRQLLITILVLFLGLFTGTFLVSSLVTRTYLDKQLSTHARDAATSLGLLLSPLIDQQDLGTATAVVDAVFDRGYYQVIQIKDEQGKVIVERRAKMNIDQVPAWFVHLMPLTAPIAEASLSAGWRQAGLVLVQSHPGYAYQELWLSSVAVFIWFLLISVLLFSIGVFALKHLFRPLEAIAYQAEVISAGQFPPQLSLPKTIQLRKVVVAMNHMVLKLKNTFDRQREEAAKLRQQVFYDAETGVYNRLYFTNRILHSVTRAEVDIHGVVILVQVEGLLKYDEINGLLASDDILKRVAKVLLAIQPNTKDAFIARLKTDTFALLILHINAQKVDALRALIVEHVNTAVNQQAEEEKLVSPCIGVITLESGLTETDILARADIALRTANSSIETDMKPNSDVKTALLTSEVQWQEMINYILEHDTSRLYGEPVHHYGTHELWHTEVLLRARDQHQHLRLSELLYPIAERLKLAHRLDQIALTRVVALIQAGDSAADELRKYAVNLTQDFLQQEDAYAWLETCLKPLQQRAHCLIIEIPEPIVVSNLPDFRAITQLLTALGVGIAIDQFGRTLSNFAYLVGNSIAYVKLDGSFTRSIAGSEENQLYVQSLLRVARSLDISIIAERVETEQEAEVLAELGVDGLQGPYIGQIERLD
jgi:diguanylate cyclase (GGDEF)-like protein